MKTPIRLLPMLLCCVVCFWVNNSLAQNKYAVIVGINDYYDHAEPAPPAPGTHSLKGCVNDAMTIQSLLKNRFGFTQENITLILNKDATQKNVVDALIRTANKAISGDAVVFYFSGHGAYIINPKNENNPIKQGQNEALCMSDLYAPGYTCLLKDNTLKKIYNLFVDKKVILTTLLDCCFSGNISAAPMPETLVGHNPFGYPEGDNNTYQKSIGDFAVYKQNGQPQNIDDSTHKAYNLTSTLTINDNEDIKSPSATKNSRFAALAGSTSGEMSQDVYDESNLKHGVFTRALLNFYELNKSDQPLSSVMKFITNEVQNRQHYSQTPTYRLDSLRNNKNLIGLPLQTNIATYTVTCTAANNTAVTINGGYYNGLAAGNVFSKKTTAGNINITLTQVSDTFAIATPGRLINIKVGDQLQLTSTYRKSEPLLKLYIPVMSITTAGFASIFKHTILPASQQKGYMDFHNFWNIATTCNYLFYNQPNATKSLDSLAHAFDSMWQQQQQCFIFLALPADLAKAIKATLQKDQNIQLVATAAEADNILYLGYSPASANNKTPGFVFTYVNVPAAISPHGYLPFPSASNYVQVASLPTTQQGLGKLFNDIRQIFNRRFREMTTKWLNNYERK